MLDIRNKKIQKARNFSNYTSASVQEKYLCVYYKVKIHVSWAISLISAFIVPCLDSIISLDSIAEISSLQLVSVAAQAGLCLVGSETPEDMFCRVVAHV